MKALIYYHNQKGLSEICASLITDDGRSPSSPVCLIQEGTTENQRVVVIKYMLVF